MIPVDTNRSDAISDLIGDTPFTVTPFFHLRWRSCDLYADDAVNPQVGIIVPHVLYPDIYFAEKLEMAGIGSSGQEVYLQACRDG
jgi:hypothetical protein